MQEWRYPGSAAEPYITRLHDDGLLECNCRGYLILKPNKPRFCKHTDDVIKKLKLNIVQRGDYRYAVEGGEIVVQPDLLPQVDHEQVYKDAHARGYIEPMLASAMTKRPKDEPLDLTIAPYLDGNWVSEVKYDGVRVIISKKDGQVNFWSRPKDGAVGKVPDIPPHIRDFCEKNLPDATLDGERIAGDTGKSYNVSDLALRDQQSIVVFDIMRVGDNDVADLTYEHRRALLAAAIPYQGQCVRMAENYAPSAQQVKDLWDNGAEGVILKRKTSVYRAGWRSPDWIKIKIEGYTVGTVISYARPNEKPKNGKYGKVWVRTDDGIETSMKTKDNSWIKKFEADPDKYLGWRLVFKHYGPTPSGKFRGPIIWDHWAGEGE